MLRFADEIQNRNKISDRGVSTSPVHEVVGQHNISYHIAFFRNKTVYRRLQWVPGASGKLKLHSRPMTATLLRIKEMDERFNGEVKRHLPLSAPGASGPVAGCKDVKFLLAKSDTAISPLASSVVSGGICAVVLSGLFNVHRAPDKGIESHADHAVSVGDAPDGISTTSMVMAALTDLPKVMFAIIKFDLEGAVWKKSVRDVLINNFRSIHIPFSKAVAEYCILPRHCNAIHLNVGGA